MSSSSSGRKSISTPTDITFVEWADRVEHLLPEDRVEIELEVTGDTTRRVTLVGTSDKLRPRGRADSLPLLSLGSPAAAKFVECIANLRPNHDRRPYRPHLCDGIVNVRSPDRWRATTPRRPPRCASNRSCNARRRFRGCSAHQ